MTLRKMASGYKEMVMGQEDILGIMTAVLA
jgi:hypothetical protein